SFTVQSFTVHVCVYTDESYKAKFLESHNEYRKKHGAPEVTYNEELCSTAQKWADHLLSIKTLKHSETDDGENVYYSWSSSAQKLTGAEAVESWYSEIKDYDFSKSGYQPKTGHFTQVVWKATTEIGLGFATDGNTVFVVGQYRTAGNITNAGYYEKNVLPLGSEYNAKSDSKPQPANGKSDSIKPQPAVADESYKAKFLESHNEYRKKHGAPEVTYNEELCSTAQKWADHLLSIKTLKHSETEDGENVYYSWSSSPQKLTGAEAVESWYSEIKDYDFSKSGYQPKTGHFTQVVWKATTEIGLGFATDGKAVFVVGQYRTAGNITNAGYYEDNVLPLGSKYNAKSDSKPQPANAKSDSKPQPAVADESYKAKFLESHNEYRKKHGAPEVTYNEELCSTAQKWADHLLSIKTLQHSETDDGENVYYSWSSSPKKLTGAEAVESWYSEIKDYDFSKPGFQSGTGHFTQVVWKATTEIGLGFATDGKAVFVVGQYRTAGNITNAGYYEKNVLPLGSEYNAKSDSKPQPANAKSDSIKPQPAVADESYKAKFLESHNEYRKKHGAPEVTYNEELCSTAQKWADHLLSIKTLQHSETDDGENVYYSWSSSPKKLTGAEAVESWYSEIKDYDFSKPGFQSGTGHFTQVVWKATTEIGLGFATDGNTVFVVGQYRPAGNMTNAGYFEKNVLPAASTANLVSSYQHLPAKNTINSEWWHSGLCQPSKLSSAWYQHWPPVRAVSELMGKNNYCYCYFIFSSITAQTAMADESYKAKFLESHNEYRKKHGAPEVTYSEELCSTAQKWADHLLSIKTLEHSETDDGENVYYSWSSCAKGLTGAEAVESWYSEIKDYDFSKPGFQSNTGHFTQVVWKATTEIGLGFATDGNTVFVVGQYRPAGNMTNAGYFEKNVLPADSFLMRPQLILLNVVCPSWWYADITLDTVALDTSQRLAVLVTDVPARRAPTICPLLNSGEP
ncbi:hypothetical protein NFI96_014715, partial [Prochilodus magdalenae]